MIPWSTFAASGPLLTSGIHVGTAIRQTMTEMGTPAGKRARYDAIIGDSCYFSAAEHILVRYTSLQQ
jgi:hypothetical protein